MYNELLDKIRQNINSKLSGLKETLYYHSAGHTFDVAKQAVRIAAAENIANERDIFLLNVAALYHDTGFLFTYKGHEEKSCEIFTEDAPMYSLSQGDISIVRSIILATKIPQLPATKLEEIICDADLDYLGREDFAEISNKLRLEFIAYSIIKNNEEFELMQFKFLTQHQFFTATSVRERNLLKQQHLADIMESLPG